MTPIESSHSNARNTENITKVSFCYLADTSAILKQVNTDLKSAQYQGEVVNTAWLQSHFKSQFTQVDQANQCAYRAYQQGVEKLPAIIFDQSYVVYGVQDIDEAIAMYQQYLQRQENNINQSNEKNLNTDNSYQNEVSGHA